MPDILVANPRIITVSRNCYDSASPFTVRLSHFWLSIYDTGVLYFHRV